MNRNTKLAVVALLLVVLGTGGLFVGYKGYKKYQAKQRQEFRYEGKITLARAGIEADMIKEELLKDVLLDRVVENYDLVNIWGLDAPQAAKERIRKKFMVRVVGVEASLTYQDKDKDLAKKLLEVIVSQGRDLPPATAPAIMPAVK